MNRDRLSDKKITVEDLFRIKRAERPAADFWVKFERDLRTKQLAAIVEKRPWWQAIPCIFAHASRFRLPLSATAVLAVTVLTVREYRMAPPAHALNESEVAPVVALAPSNSHGETFDSAFAALVETAVVDRGETSTPSEAPSILTASIQSEPEAALLTETLAPHVSLRSTRKLEDSTLAQMADSELMPAPIGTTPHFEARFSSSRMDEPLARVRTPMDDRRARFLSTALPNSYVHDTPQMRAGLPDGESLEVRLNERRLRESDEASRFGARGDRLLIKL